MDKYMQEIKTAYAQLKKLVDAGKRARTALKGEDTP